MVGVLRGRVVGLVVAGAAVGAGEALGEFLVEQVLAVEQLHDEEVLRVDHLHHLCGEAGLHSLRALRCVLQSPKGRPAAELLFVDHLQCIVAIIGGGNGRFTVILPRKIKLHPVIHAIAQRCHRGLLITSIPIQHHSSKPFFQSFIFNHKSEVAQQFQGQYHSMFHEIGIDLLQDSCAEFLREFFHFLLREQQLNFILLCIRENILDDNLLGFIAVLEVGILAVAAVDAVVVEILEEFGEDRGYFRVDHLLLLFLLGRVWLASLLHELLILLLQDHTLGVRGFHVTIGSQDHPFDQVLLLPFQAQQFRDCGIDFDVDCEDLIEGAADIDRDGGDDSLEQFGDIEDVDPVGGLRGGDEDVKGEELMVGCVVDSLLDLLGTVLDCLWVIDGPIAAEVLAVDGKLEHPRVMVLDVAVDFRDAVVELGDEVPRIIETFIEVLAGVVAGDGDILGEEVGPTAVFHELSVEVDGEVGAMDLFGGGPEDLGGCVAELADAVDELGPGGVFQGGVLLEDQVLLQDVDRHLLLFLHPAILLYPGQASTVLRMGDDHFWLKRIFLREQLEGGWTIQGVERCGQQTKLRFVDFGFKCSQIINNRLSLLTLSILIPSPPSRFKISPELPIPEAPLKAR